MSAFDDQLVKLAGRQHFVISRSQLLELGSERQLEHRIRRGSIARVYQCVYRIPGSPETWRQKVMAACFAGGKFSVGAFRTAAALQLLPGGDELVEIASQRWRRARHDGVIPHESHHLTDLDMMYIDNIPVTRPARTLNDLALLVQLGELDMATLEHAMHEAVRRDLVDVRRVWREWERLGGRLRRSGVTMETMLTRFVPPIRKPDSSAETRLLQLVRAANLPEPIPQFRVWLTPTRWVDLDKAWPDRKVFAEFDPYKWHGDRDKYMRDATRRLELRAKGWDGVSITDDELDAGAPLALEVLRGLLERRPA